MYGLQCTYSAICGLYRDFLPNISLVPSSQDSPRIFHLQFENPSDVSSMSVRLGLDGGSDSNVEMKKKKPEDLWMLADPQFILSPKEERSAPVVLSKNDSDLVILKNACLVPVRWRSASLPSPSEVFKFNCLYVKFAPNSCHVAQITLMVSCSLNNNNNNKSTTFRVRISLKEGSQP
jgi:hypothetical protein